MRVDSVRFNEETGRFRAVLVGPDVAREGLSRATLLRCGAYRWKLCEPLQFYEATDRSPPALAADLEGPNEPQLGMVTYPLERPLLNEEVASHLQHLLMVPRLLMGIDSLGFGERIAKLRAQGIALDPDVAKSLEALEDLALEVTRLTDKLPALNHFTEADRIKPELLRALCR